MAACRSNLRWLPKPPDVPQLLVPEGLARELDPERLSSPMAPPCEPVIPGPELVCVRCRRTSSAPLPPCSALVVLPPEVAAGIDAASSSSPPRPTCGVMPQPDGVRRRDHASEEPPASAAARYPLPCL